jgi:hypothetical protein
MSPSALGHVSQMEKYISAEFLATLSRDNLIPSLMRNGR